MPAVALLRHVVADADGDPAAARDVLDAAAGQIGGFDLDGYRQVLDIDARLSAEQAGAWAAKLLNLIEASGVPRRFALAALAQPEVTDTRRRATGAYYTDFRLARYLARRMMRLPAAPLTPAGGVIDTAAGTGVLLVALAEQIGRDDPGALRDLVAHGLCAVDRDPRCRWATLATLASLTADLGAIARLATRIKTADSLVADHALWEGLRAGGRFDAVIGNPPWDRLRVTRHETLLAGGSRRHYGADYEPEPPIGRTAHRGEADQVRRYVAELASRYTLLGDRKIDLYQAFLALGWDLVKAGGSLGMLLPAGLIRAQGTRLLREHLLTNSADVDVTVFHNRSHFFGIDSRFKFLAVCARVCGSREAGVAGATVRLRHSEGNDRGIPEPMPVLIKFGELAVRRDLTVPEVTGDREWRLFQHMTAQGSRPSDP
ncbi:MAG: Eco57I restriction-modification methylase domain-containing protein, partial [Actinomycetes bacterium]